MEEDKDKDNLVELCKSGILPKLPFLIENLDEKSSEKYFNPSCESDSNSGDNVNVRPLSVREKEKVLSLLLERVQQKGSLEWWTKLCPTSRALIILFLSENWDGSRPWSSDKCQGLVVEVCEELCSKINDESLENLQRQYLGLWFVKNFEESLTPHESDFHNILRIVKTKFTQSEWKYFPASAHGFGWILKQIKYPFLGNVIEKVIPPALLFTDDYYDDHKKLGLICLSYIVQNVDRTDLMQSNWASVIYDASFRFCSDKDPEVIEVVMPVLMKILLITEKDPSEYSAEFTKYDDVLKSIVFEIDMCSDVNLKRTWLLRLDSFLTVIGTATLHWSDMICIMLRDATVSNDISLWNIVLQVTSTLIRNTWAKADCKSIGEIILRVLLNCSCFQNDKNMDDQKSELIDNAKEALGLLSKCDGYEIISVQFKHLVEKGDSQLLHPAFIKLLKDVLGE